MKKTKLLTTLGAVALIGAIGVGSTFAYLSDKTETVTNTFTVGNVTITLDETDYDDSTADADRDTANTYVDMIPGTTYTKDPIVHLGAGSVESYVFVKVTGLDDNADILSLVDSKLGTSWEAVEVADGKQDGIYVYNTTVKNETADAIDLDALFTAVTLNQDFEGGNITEITVEACAVQAGNLEQADALTQAKSVADWK